MKHWSEPGGCSRRDLESSAAVPTMVHKCVPLSTDLAVLWPLLSTLLLPLALSGE